MPPRVCIDLFAGIGGFSSAFDKQPGWEVVTVEIDEKHNPDITADVMDLTSQDLPDAEVVVASIPCQVFSPASNGEGHFEDKLPVTDRAKEHVRLAYHTVGLIRAIDPDYWFVENPQGKLRWFLGEPAGRVTYCQYGRDYMKPTYLWGKHPNTLEYKTCTVGSGCHVSNKSDDGTSAVGSMPRDVSKRSMVPYMLSLSILSAVEEEM